MKSVSRRKIFLVALKAAYGIAADRTVKDRKSLDPEKPSFKKSRIAKKTK